MAYPKYLLMLRVFFLFYLIHSTVNIQAQNYLTRQTAPPKALKAFEQAQAYSRAGQTEAALKQVDAILRQNPAFIDAMLLRAALRMDANQYAQAEADYLQAVTLAPEYDPRAWYPLGLSQLRQAKYEQALHSFEKYLQSPGARNEAQRTRAEQYAANARFAVEAIKKPVPFDPRPLSDSINTSAPESLPSLTADGNILVFTRMVNGQEDFYFSRRLPDGAWSKAEPLAGINTPYNEGAQCISADGRTLVFNACNTPDGFGSCDLYLSRWENGRWSRPQNLGDPVNSKYLERQPTLSADGKVILFSSDRPGGYGGRDIWLTRLKPDGQWSPPVNLGPQINTAGNEDCPFFHADSRTLYFMSDGHPGMGGFDLFVSRLNADGFFGKPENLGYPINTLANEGGLILSLDGATAYYTSDARDSRAQPGQNRAGINTDIFTFDMPPSLRPYPVTYVKASIRDAHTRRPLSAEVSLYAMPDNRLLQNDRAADDGTLLYCLPAGQNYALHIVHPGYVFHTARFELDSVHRPEQPFLLRVDLMPLPVASDASTATSTTSVPVILHNILFDTGSALFLPESRAELNRLQQFLKDNPQVHIRINGHTDNTGAPEANQLLSEKRAKAVCDYLILGGIAPERLQYKGYGENRPIASNSTPEGRRQNRRTEFEILQK